MLAGCATQPQTQVGGFRASRDCRQNKCEFQFHRGISPASTSKSQWLEFRVPFSQQEEGRKAAAIAFTHDCRITCRSFDAFDGKEAPAAGVHACRVSAA
mmetsp:Transcript_8929/g.21147  ORF Transcript_8929/g.21147 Transcript_8929/m.21147 type:complete len:99 (-) Transcript_8929:163-459(-)